MFINRKVTKDVLKLALPAVGEMILYMMIWVLDTMMVGRYGGKTAVSAVGLSSEILYTFVNIFISIGISVAMTSLVARKFGANDISATEKFATIGFVIGTLLSLIITITLFVFAKDILILAGANSNVLRLGTIYMKIVSFGLFFNMLTAMLNGILRGYGNTLTPLITSGIINIINLSLDAILIFGLFNFPELGIAGAAIATAVAHTIGFIFSSIYLWKKSNIKLRPKLLLSYSITDVKEVIKLAIPSSLQEASFDISRLLCVFMIMRIGEVSFAANQITTTIESLSFMPGWGFAIAATTLVGQKTGEKKYKEAKEYAYASVALGTFLMGICSLIFFLFPTFFIKLFITKDEVDVITLGIQCLKIAALEQIPIAISMILGGALKGAGDTKIPFKISFISSWFIRLPLMYYFIYIMNFSVVYVWWITAVQWIFEAVFMIFVFRKKLTSRFVQ
ncbi:MATE family efflux transporter [Clostridium grantii]|uniref:Probable multidrug resistance protein NorM n=1 Tax=Clostridium grantii DSM 8605 TaxID=1121316 RepID=A0A1M5XID0_9CLOT|nr:MATE family efflux transporter [Clostridium grantii]SHH99509.1 putative efflux protein, MATE family [Clostridium grantii DSM 8605]